MEIETIPIISTGHVSEETANAIYDGGLGDLMKSVYGWIIWVCPDAEIDPYEWPQDLATVVDWAREQGYMYVMFDRDADTIEGLPIYDW